MNIGSDRFSCAQAKGLDLVDYLASLGFAPDKIKGADYWYRSPLRAERTASFKINRKKNVWFDHGTGQGGTLIDFGLLYHKCSVGELLATLAGHLSFHQPVLKVAFAEPEEPPIRILSEIGIVSLSLLRYLRQRRIAEIVAKKYCQEIRFALNGKVYTAIGFANDEGGVELRNPWYKGSTAPKALTRIENGSKEVSVFEGFFDFLSHQTIQLNQPASGADFLVLNSTAFFEKSRPFMEQHECIRLFLDRDRTGQNCIRQALSWSAKYQDESGLYTGYKDLNDWAQHIGKSLKKGVGPLR